jgi:F0F1-type ATP synthase gamma subunit
MQLLPYTGENAELLEKVIYEPFADKVVDYLLRKWLLYKVQEVCWSSKLSELSARAMHLEGSLRELQDMKKGIELQYFRSKHEVTDRMIRDIFGGWLASKRRLTIFERLTNDK